MNGTPIDLPFASSADHTKLWTTTTTTSNKQQQIHSPIIIYREHDQKEALQLM
jgi:hypothetical protein